VHTDLSGYALTVLDSVGDGVIVINGEGVVTLMNPAAEEMTGRSRRQVVRLTFYRLL
jgi:two-component system, NtrC family, nitrogen regulation sensor histidine kinase GlnL